MDRPVTNFADNWTLRCRSLLLHPDDNGDDDDDDDERARRQSIPFDGTADFGEALKSLPLKEFYRSRLANALHALDSVARAMPLLSSSSSSLDIGGGPLPCSAAALDGLLVAGEGDLPDDGGSSSQPMASFERLRLPGVVCGPCFPFGTYSTVDGGVPKRSKNDHFIPFCSMNDNGMIIGSK